LNKGALRNRAPLQNVVDGATIYGSMPTNTKIEMDLVNAGATAYQSSFPNGGIKISGAIKGCTKLKPQQTMVFDSSVPARYQGKTFRPTYLSYNFVSDIIRFAAYQI
jgi:hypothetical protein